MDPARLAEDHGEGGEQMKQETRKRKEQRQEEPITIQEFLGALLPPDIVDKIVEDVEKERKQRREQKGAKE